MRQRTMHRLDLFYVITAIVALSLALALLVSPGAGRAAPVQQQGIIQPPGTWRSVPVGSILDHRGHFASVWTGKELIVWGGEGCVRVYCGDGARYNPLTGAWTALSMLHAPSPRSFASAVWTGKEMIVWGGESGPPILPQGQGGALGDGARYDPLADTWKPLASYGAPSPRVDHAAVWTGREMIIWGGYGPSGLLGDGARYDPVANTWRPVQSVGAPSPRDGFSSLWSGNVMIVWGGDDSSVGRHGGGASFNPEMNAWSALPTSGAPSPRYAQAQVWTGREMLVWGGAFGPPPPYDHTLGDGAAYVPATDTWATLPTAGAPSPRSSAVAVWSGREMIIWGGNSRDHGPADAGGRYDPTTHSWRPIPATGAPQYCYASSAFWTGQSMLVIGCVNPFAAQYVPPAPDAAT